MAATAVGVEFTWKTCATGGCRGSRVGTGDRCVVHLDEASLAVCLSGFKRGRVLDVRGVTIGPELLRQILDSAPADGEGRPRFGSARFDRACFEGDACFDGVTFGREVSFDGAVFAGEASFRDAVFESSARFAQARVAGGAHFDGAAFLTDAWFAAANFGASVSFEGASFAGPARFAQVDFQVDARFDEATFSNDASFENASFGCHAEFGRATFEGDARFAGATLTREATFHDTAFNGRNGIPDMAALRRVAWSGPPLASWGRRAGAALVDHAVPVGMCLAAAVAAMAMAWLQHDALVPLCLLGGVGLAVGFTLKNLAGQGRTGQTLGKRRMGLRLLRERDRRPVGVGLSIARQFLHTLDTVPLFVGWLRPLRDPKRQTWADTILGTVVVVVGDRWHQANQPQPATPGPAGGPIGSGCGC